MKKLTFLILFIFLCSITISANAYSLGSGYPSSQYITWHPHETLDSTWLNAVIAATQTWNNANTGFVLFRSTTTTTGEIKWDDSRTDIGFISFIDYGITPANAVCVFYAPGPFDYFDIVFNSDRTSWGDTVTSLDRQGIATHELGHALGLAEVYGDYGTDLNNVPTMYGYSTYYLGSTPYNVSYYFRTLTADDINGAKASFARLR